MSKSENFFMKLNDFQQNLTTTFRALRTDTDFNDVTLVCEDGQQVEAHKVILSASSPFFQNLLVRNKHAHPLIYMRGMKLEELVAILDFLYHGETNIDQENLNDFLIIAEELKLKGLSECDQILPEDENYFDPTMPTVQPKWLQKSKEYNNKDVQFMANIGDLKIDQCNSRSPEIKNIRQLTNDMRKPIENEPTNIAVKVKHETDQFCNESPFNETILQQSEFVSADLHSLDEQIKSMYIKKDGQMIYVCNICGKETNKKSNMKDHIEAKHMEGLSLPCNFCDKTFR